MRGDSSSRAWTGAATAAGAVLDAAAPVLADAAEGVAESAANAAEDVAKLTRHPDERPTSRRRGAACATAAGAVASSANFLGKLEIVRDFYQVLSLFVVHAHRALTGALDWLAVLAGMSRRASDFVFDIPARACGTAIGVTLGVVAMACRRLVARFETSAQLEHHREREGNEFPGRTRTRRTTAACDLPLHVRRPHHRVFARLAVLARGAALRHHARRLCAARLRGTRRRSTGSCRRSGARLSERDVAFPIQCYFLIEANKPVGSLEDADHRYNDDGDLVEYTDANPVRDLLEPEQKKNPYYFLYKDYERSHSAFKVHRR